MRVDKIIDKIDYKEFAYSSYKFSLFAILIFNSANRLQALGNLIKILPVFRFYVSVKKLSFVVLFNQ